MIRPVAAHAAFRRSFDEGFDKDVKRKGSKATKQITNKIGLLAVTSDLSQYYTNPDAQHKNLNRRFLRIRVPSIWRRLFAINWVAKVAGRPGQTIELILPVGLSPDRREFDYGSGLNPYKECAQEICRDFEAGLARQFEFWTYDSNGRGFTRQFLTAAQWRFERAKN